jgi:hypothetical protein
MKSIKTPKFSLANNFKEFKVNNFKSLSQIQQENVDIIPQTTREKKASVFNFPSNKRSSRLNTLRNYEENKPKLANQLSILNLKEI